MFCFCWNRNSLQVGIPRQNSLKRGFTAFDGISELVHFQKKYHYCGSNPCKIHTIIQEITSKTRKGIYLISLDIFCRTTIYAFDWQVPAYFHVLLNKRLIPFSYLHYQVKIIENIPQVAEIFHLARDVPPAS